MYKLNWIFCNGSRWFQDFDTENDAIDYANHCDLLRAFTVSKVWITSNDSKIWLKGKL